MTYDDEERPAGLATLVQKLTAAVEVLAERFRRKRISDAVLAFVVTGMLAAGALYYFVELPDRREDTRNQIRDLACYAVRLRPPGYSASSDSLRAKYHCPAFNPADLPAGASTVAPQPGSTVTVRVPEPAATRTVTRSATASSRPGAAGLPGPTRTRTVSVTPARPAPVTRTVHAAPRTVVRTATVTRGVCLPLLCPTTHR